MGSSRPFQPGSLRGNVVLGLGHDPSSHFGAWATAFQEAGRALAQKLIDAPGYSDLDACPIIFLYRHALELHLKGLVLQARQLHKYRDVQFPEVDGLLSKHKLAPLLSPIALGMKLVDLKWDLEAPAPTSFDELGRLLRAIDEVDDQSMSFRYPVGKDYSSALLPSNFLLNIGHFAETVEAALDGMHSLLYAFDYELDQEDVRKAREGA